MNELTRKKVSRKALLKHCKKLESEIADLLKCFEQARLVELKALKLNYKDQIDRIAAIDDDILDLITDEDQLESEITNALSEKDTFYTILSKIDHCLGNVRLLPPTPISPDTSPPTVRRVVEKKAKLPKIEIQKFDGNILNWQSFWSQFELSIHNESRLSDIDKLFYLKNFLSPAALECISELPLTNDNYTQTVRVLRERYENTQLLIYAYMEAFTKLPKVKSMKQASELRVMYKQLENIVKNLTILNVETEVYGLFLVPVLTKKLPNELTLVLSQTFGDEAWELKDIMIVLKEELDAIERCCFCKETTSKPQGNHSSDNTLNLHQDQVPQMQFLHKKPRNISFNDMMNLHQEQLKQMQFIFKITCPFCHSVRHPPSQCHNVTDVNSRVDLLRGQARCFVCLKGGHIAKNCPSGYQCETCGERHHVSICDIDNTSDQTLVGSIPEKDEDDDEDDLDDETDVQDEERYSSFVGSGKKFVGSERKQRRLLRAESCP